MYKKIKYIFLLISIGMISYFLLADDVGEKYFIKLAIFPTGTSDESYLFTVGKDKILNCFKGIRNEILDIHSFFDQIYEDKSKKLNNSEYMKLEKILETFDRNIQTKDKIDATDSWDVVLFYRDNIYQINYWNNNCDDLINLTNEIIKLSPIKVDIHGWS